MLLSFFQWYSKSLSSYNSYTKSQPDQRLAKLISSITTFKITGRTRSVWADLNLHHIVLQFLIHCYNHKCGYIFNMRKGPLGPVTVLSIYMQKRLSTLVRLAISGKTPVPVSANNCVCKCIQCHHVSGYFHLGKHYTPRRRPKQPGLYSWSITTVLVIKTLIDMKSIPYIRFW